MGNEAGATPERAREGPRNASGINIVIHHAFGNRMNIGHNLYGMEYSEVLHCGSMNREASTCSVLSSVVLQLRTVCIVNVITSKESN